MVSCPVPVVASPQLYNGREPRGSTKLQVFLKLLEPVSETTSQQFMEGQQHSPVGFKSSEFLQKSQEMWQEANGD